MARPKSEVGGRTISFYVKGEWLDGLSRVHTDVREAIRVLILRQVMVCDGEEAPEAVTAADQVEPVAKVVKSGKRLCARCERVAPGVGVAGCQACEA